MKRTAEITLTSIGLALSSLSALVLTFLMIFSNTGDFREAFQDGFVEGAGEEGVLTTSSEADIFLNFLLGFGWLVLVALIIGTILAIISIYFFSGNKKPVAASVMTILAAVIIGIGTIFTGFLPAILFLIAGIVGLVRKPPIVDPFESTDTEII